MTSTVSTADNSTLNNNSNLIKKESFMKHYFLMSLKKSRKIMIILSVLQIIGLPLVEILCTCSMKANLDENYSVADIFSILATFALVLAVVFFICSALAGITFALQSFNYLHKKTVTDMYYSLPVSTNERFFADFFSGLISYLVPQLVGFVVTLPTTLICTKIVPQINEELSWYGIDSAINVIVKGYALLFALMVMFYVLSALVNVLCGQLFETLVYTVGINVLIPGAIAIIFVILFENAYGISFGGLSLNIIRMTSPLGVLIYYFNGMYRTSESEFFGTYFTGSQLLAQIGYMLIFTVIYFALTYLLYRKRKSEDVGKPFVYMFTFYLVAVCIILCISAIGVVKEVAVHIGTAFASLIFFMIIDIVTKRARYSVKSFFKSLLTGVVIVAAATSFVVICNNSNGFGIVSRVPKASDVKSVSIEFNSYSLTAEYNGYNDLENMLSYSPITFDDKEMIEKIVALHGDIVENYKQNRETYDSEYGSLTNNYYDYVYVESVDDADNSSSSGYISITYRLDNDLTMSRNYDIYGNYYEILGKYLNDRDFIYALYEKRSEEILKNININDRHLGFEPINYTDSYQTFEVEPTVELMAEIFNAYTDDFVLNDMKNTNMCEELGEIYFPQGFIIHVYEENENLITVLKEKMGVEDFYLVPFSEGVEMIKNGTFNAQLLDSSYISIEINLDQNGYKHALYSLISGNEEIIYELSDLVKKIKSVDPLDENYTWSYDNYITYNEIFVHFPDELIPDVVAFAEKYVDEEYSEFENFDDIRLQAKNQMTIDS